MITALEYHRILVSAGLPIAGVSLNGSARVNAWLTPPTPEQELRAVSLLAAACPIELSADRTTIPADGVTPATITVTCAVDVPSVALWIGAVVHTVPLTNCIGEVQIVREVGTLPPHIVLRAQNQQVYGYAQIVIVAE